MREIYENEKRRPRSCPPFSISPIIRRTRKLSNRTFVKRNSSFSKVRNFSGSISVSQTDTELLREFPIQIPNLSRLQRSKTECNFNQINKNQRFSPGKPSRITSSEKSLSQSNSCSHDTQDLESQIDLGENRVSSIRKYRTLQGRLATSEELQMLSELDDLDRLLNDLTDRIVSIETNHESCILILQFICVGRR